MQQIPGQDRVGPSQAGRQFAVTPDMGPAWVETPPVARFHGVGPVTAAMMKRLGIELGAELRRLERERWVCPIQAVPSRWLCPPERSTNADERKSAIGKRKFGAEGLMRKQDPHPDIYELLSAAQLRLLVDFAA